MEKVKKHIFILFIFGILAGCATVSSVRYFYEKIDYSDGVSKDEAKLIAKKHLIDSVYKYDYRVINPEIRTWYEKDAWIVRFPPKKVQLLIPEGLFEAVMPNAYLVAVDKRTGAVIKGGRWGFEPFMHQFIDSIDEKER